MSRFDFGAYLVAGWRMDDGQDGMEEALCGVMMLMSLSTLVVMVVGHCGR